MMWAILIILGGGLSLLGLSLYNIYRIGRLNSKLKIERQAMEHANKVLKHAYKDHDKIDNRTPNDLINDRHKLRDYLKAAQDSKAK